MKIKNIYDKFQIPQNLQEHMLRVGALSLVITDNWTGPAINSSSIIQAGLLHDIAKPLNFDLERQAQFGMSPDDIENLANLQDLIKEKYAEDEHSALVAIIRDLGCESTVLKIIDKFEWIYIPQLIEDEALESLITIYSDMRIGPRGILSLQERLSELKSRVFDEHMEEHIRNSQALEDIINKNVSFDLNSITDKKINELFNSLLDISL